ncbi:RHS repeat-associated core domain-containing protein [Streptomyces sp. UC4497]
MELSLHQRSKGHRSHIAIEEAHGRHWRPCAHLLSRAYRPVPPRSPLPTTPNIGRFTQPDPSGQEKNPYLYAEGDPVNRIDPTGLLDWKSFTVGVVTTAAIGAAAVTVGAACGATAGLACAAAGAVTAGLWGGQPLAELPLHSALTPSRP